MTSAARPIGRLRMKPAIGLLIAFGLILLVAANAHLLYVAVTSQPECVAHVRRGEGNARNNSFSAATSSCSPKAAKPTKASAE